MEEAGKNNCNYSCHQHDGLVVASDSKGSDVESAVADAWGLVDPEFDLASGDVIDQPATGGLERFVIIPYDTDDESTAPLAVAQRHGASGEGSTIPESYGKIRANCARLPTP